MNKSFKNMLCMLMLLLGGVSMAQAKVVVSLSQSTLHIAPLETATLSVNIENDVDVYGLQCDITLPSSLEFVSSDAENGIFDNGTRFPQGLDILQNAKISKQKARLAIVPRQNAFNYLKAGSGAVVSFKVIAKFGSFLSPNDSIKFSKVNAYGEDDALLENVTAKNSGFKNSVTNPNIVLSTETTGEIEWQEKTPIVVNLLTDVPSNSNPVSNVQFDVTMPTGTKLLGEYVKGERLQNSHIVLIAKNENTDDNTYRVTIQSSSNAALLGTDGSLVTLYATTGSPYASDTKDIVISNQVYSKTDGTKVAPDPELETIEVPVTIPEADQKKIHADADGDGILNSNDLSIVIDNILQNTGKYNSNDLSVIIDEILAQ